LGKLYYGQQRFREALLQFETIFRKEHSHAEAVWLSSLCMIRIGWQQDAFDRLQYLLQISPRHAGAHRELGFLCETWKLDKAQADFHYRESLRLDPQQTDLKSRLGGLTPDPTDGPDLMQPNRNNLAPAIPSAPIPGIPGSGAGMPGIPSIPTPTSVTNVR
jgi:tetratricopeptide (TPR) repeat protein